MKNKTLSNAAILVIFATAFILSTVSSANAAVFSVTTVADGGAGSLRQAISDANSQPGFDSIIFNISGGGVQTIALAADLPKITDAVIIDATTQPGYGGSPIIELKGIGTAGTSYGLTVDAGNTTIRGFVINNFNSGGIGIFTKDGNRIENNFIGVDIAGTEVRRNFGEGIDIFDSSNNIIGGTTAAARNVISGNTGTGIYIQRSSGNVIRGNFIGTDITGTKRLPNGEFGISIFENAQNNVIGGTAAGEGNVVTFNGRAGISIAKPSSSDLPVTGNSIRGNSIFSNFLLGIDLAQGNNSPGITPNDACDIDGGANNLQNFPVLQTAVSNGVTTTVVGSINSTPNTDFNIDFYASTTFNTNAIGDAKTYIGSVNVTTAGNCGANFSATLPFRNLGNQFINATATDSNGNTSEFSQFVRAAGARVNPSFDFDGDGKSDVSVYRPSDRVWYIRNSGDASVGYTQFGLSADRIAPADYDGDGRTDIAVFRPETGVWFITKSTGGFLFVQFGTAEDLPQPADFNGDGKAEVAVFRPSIGVWFILNTDTFASTATQFGAAEDKPVTGDYDGDGKSDIAVYRPSLGVWFVAKSTTGQTAATRFGASADKPVPADYDGDRITDFALYLPTEGNWYLLQSDFQTNFSITKFGLAADTPVPADYDGDGRADLAVYRPGEGNWYQLNSRDGFAVTKFGLEIDKPTPNAFVY